MILVSLVLATVCVVLLVVVLALVDQYRTLELIREDLGLNDRPEPIGLPDPAPTPSQLGLPESWDVPEHLVLLFLSTTCTTCASIARKLNGRIPSTLQVILEVTGHGAPEEWLDDVGLRGQGVIVDVESAIADGLQLSITPAAVIYQRGTLRMAQTIPSYRQLEPLLKPSSLSLLSPGSEREVTDA
jgi:hypothetical protein